jgi:hypothetical protein
VQDADKFKFQIEESQVLEACFTHWQELEK